MMVFPHYKNFETTYLFRTSFCSVAILLLVCLISIHSFSQAPNWQWANRMGGAGTDWTTFVTVDASGNSYVTGHYYSSTITFGGTTLTNSGLTDIFLVKYDATGNVLWAKRAGNAGSDWGYSVATDAAGNVYLAGLFNSSTIAFGATTLATAGWYDIFLAKYDASGNVLWARSAGGIQNDFAVSVAASASGGIYLAGTFTSPSITFGSTTLSNAGGSDVFVTKYDAAGNALWAHCVGDQSEETTNSVATDAAGNVYLSGFFLSLDIAIGATTLTNPNGCVSEEIFLAKYDAAGNTLWAKSASGFYSDYVYGIAADVSGNVYITGFFYSTSLTFGSITLSGSGGSPYIYLAKYNSAGTEQWAINPGYGIGTCVATDACGDIYMTGYFGGTSITFGATTLTNSGSYDIYGAKISPAGSALWAKKAGGTDYDVSNSIAISPANNDILIAGYYHSSSIAFGSTTLTNADVDGFVAKLDSTCSLIILPLELISFTGKNEDNRNVIEWATGSEINNDYFSVERSDDGKSFKTIGNVDGSGNSTITLTYSFADTYPMQGINYYRLRQTDYDGTTSISNVISVKNESGGTNPVIISPNPAHDFISVNATGSFELEIINTLGELIARTHGENRIDISEFPGGIYFLNIKTKDNQYFHEFVKY